MIYAYYRVSTQTQVENNGTQMQRDVIKTFCEKNNMVIDAEYSDEGISGTIVERDGIMDLISVLQPGDTIIVQNTSRLWRSDMAKVMIRREIEKAKAKVVSVEQPSYDIYTKDPNDFLINSMMELLDQYERMNIAMKLAKGRKARAKTGQKPCGTAPFGYKWENGKVVIDYNNHIIVRDIFSAYCNLQSLGKLQDYCIDKGYKTSTGRDFSKQSLKNIISNDFYVGIVTYAGKKITGDQPVFIDSAIFDKANAVLTR